MDKLQNNLSLLLQEDDRIGKDGSYVKCYMNDHPEVYMEKAREHTKHKISETWKCLNKESFNPTNPFHSSFSKVCLNVARMVPMMYRYDNCSPSKLEQHVRSLLYGGDGTRENISKDQTLVL